VYFDLFIYLIGDASSNGFASFKWMLDFFSFFSFSFYVHLTHSIFMDIRFLLYKVLIQDCREPFPVFFRVFGCEESSTLPDHASNNSDI